MLRRTDEQQHKYAKGLFSETGLPLELLSIEEDLNKVIQYFRLKETTYKRRNTRRRLYTFISLMVIVFLIIFVIFMLFNKDMVIASIDQFGKQIGSFSSLSTVILALAAATSTLVSDRMKPILEALYKLYSGKASESYLEITIGKDSRRIVTKVNTSKKKRKKIMKVKEPEQFRPVEGEVALRIVFNLLKILEKCEFEKQIHYILDKAAIKKYQANLIRETILQVKGPFIKEFRTGDIVTDTLFKSNMLGFANALEDKIIWILHPKKETRENLERFLINTIICFMNYEWDALERKNIPSLKYSTWWSGVTMWLRKINGAIFKITIPIIAYMVVFEYYPSLVPAIFPWLLAIEIINVLAIFYSDQIPTLLSNSKSVHDMIWPPKS